MYHSITFGNKNTWTDWHLVPTSRPVISPPSVKTRYLEIPGANGVIDLTESLTGKPFYNNREGNFEFYVLNQYDLEGPTTYNWPDVYSEILTYLHGQSMKMVLEDDPGYYYEGRFSVDSWKTDRDRSTITVSYNLEPFKYPIFREFTASDFQLGAFDYSSSGGTVSISEIGSNVSAITVDPARPYVAGDAIRFDNAYRYNIAIWSRIQPTKNAIDYVQYSQIDTSGEYVFPVIESGGVSYEGGYYKVMMYKPSSPIISSDDFAAFAAAISYYPKGVF